MTISTAGGEEYMYLNILKYIVGIMFTLRSFGFFLNPYNHSSEGLSLNCTRRLNV